MGIWGTVGRGTDDKVRSTIRCVLSLPYRDLIADASIIQADRWEQQKNCSVALQPNAQHDVHNAPRGAPLAEIHGNPEALKPWPDKRAT